MGQVRLMGRLVRWSAPGCTPLNDIRFTLVLPQRHQSGIHVVAGGIGGAAGRHRWVTGGATGVGEIYDPNESVENVDSILLSISEVISCYRTETVSAKTGKGPKGPSSAAGGCSPAATAAAPINRVPLSSDRS